MSSITRAFEILERFRLVQRPLSLTELVRDFGYPSSSVADILKTLSHGGYISFDPITRTYFPTTRLGELGDWIMTEILPRSYPVEMLKELRAATGDTVLLGTPNDLEVLYLAVLEAKEPGRPITTGRRTHRPLVKSGVGCALLSLEEDDFIERVYRRSLARGLCDRKEFPLDALMRQIEACRRDGFIFIKDSINPNAAIVAAPVPIAYHAQRLAIGIGGPADRIEQRIDPIVGILKAQLQSLVPAAEPALTRP
jgi:DNA-binding IclR family transcriptional regulator